MSDYKNDSLASLFADKTYCAEEILRVREAIGMRSATEATYRAAFRTLGLMLLNCPEDMQTLVRSQLHETTTRQGYAVMAGMEME